jgi:hypothetical protein
MKLGAGNQIVAQTATILQNKECQKHQVCFWQWARPQSRAIRCCSVNAGAGEGMREVQCFTLPHNPNRRAHRKPKLGFWQ